MQQKVLNLQVFVGSAAWLTMSSSPISFFNCWFPVCFLTGLHSLPGHRDVAAWNNIFIDQVVGVCFGNQGFRGSKCFAKSARNWRQKGLATAAQVLWMLMPYDAPYIWPQLSPKVTTASRSELGGTRLRHLTDSAWRMPTIPKESRMFCCFA